MYHTDIANCFNQAFLDAYHTRMVGGAAEPLYLPATAEQPAQLFYREDFAASALHEAAHWCIAGARRRTQVDFGYAYQPPPRSAQQQQRFFALEVRTQALESLFASAAGVRFQPSADNLGSDIAPFAAQVEAALPQVRSWLQSSKDARAGQFLAALVKAASAQQRIEHGTG